MPFKSEAQRRYFHAAAERGEISKRKVHEYEEKTKGDLPERVGSESKKRAAKDKARRYTEKRTREKDAQSS